ncbi:Cc8L18.2-like protein [Daphnia magna]|uniref:Cc8L18.2-like protein n=1 Tax=Daphnia magna TaxID=35525 RepID=A0A164MA78_9CRUS|nr:Cc8L18.2-like protein [Daphnia magna]
MDQLVCSVYTKECMMTRCPSCPGADCLEKFLEESINDETEDVITY